MLASAIVAMDVGTKMIRVKDEIYSDDECKSNRNSSRESSSGTIFFFLLSDVLFQTSKAFLWMGRILKPRMLLRKSELNLMLLERAVSLSTLTL